LALRPNSPKGEQDCRPPISGEHHGSSEPPEGKRLSAGNDAAWLEKLARASREAFERVRKLGDPFARDLANDLEKLSAHMARQLDEARSAARPSARPTLAPSPNVFSRLRPRGGSYSLLIVPIMLAVIAITG
jgi:hypothetical protein